MKSCTDPGVDSNGSEVRGAPQRQGADLTKRVKSGVTWTMLGYGSSQVLRLMSNLVLTRLLFEEVFGLMALMQVILQGLHLLSDIGIGPSVIHSERTDRRFTDTAFTVSMIRGATLFVIGCVLAAPLSRFYEMPELETLLPYIAFTALLGGVESTKIYTMNRELQLARVQMMSLISQFAATCVTVGWALMSQTVWALIGGIIAGGLVRIVLSHVWLPGPTNRLAWDRGALSSLVKYGSWVFLGTLLSFLAEQSDRLIFAKLVPLDLLGIYAIAAMIAMVPFSGLAQMSWNVLFPYVSRLSSDITDFRDSFERVRQPLFILGGWALSGLLAGGPTAIAILYDPRYHAAGWMVQLIAIPYWLQLICVTNDAAAWGRGKPFLASLGSLAKLIAIAVLLPLGFMVGSRVGPGYGFVGAIVGVGCSDLVRYIVSASGSATLGLRPWKQDLRGTALLLLSGGGGAVLENALRKAGHSSPMIAVCVFACVTAFWVIPAIRTFKRRQTKPL